MTLPEILDSYAACQRALHTLWTAAVGTPGYDKPTWQALARDLDRITRSAATAAGHSPTAPLVSTGALVPAGDIEHRMMIRYAGAHPIGQEPAECYCSCGYTTPPGLGIDSDTAIAHHLAAVAAARGAVMEIAKNVIIASKYVLTYGYRSVATDLDLVSAHEVWAPTKNGIADAMLGTTAGRHGRALARPVQPRWSGDTIVWLEAAKAGQAVLPVALFTTDGSLNQLAYRLVVRETYETYEETVLR